MWMWREQRRGKDSPRSCTLGPLYLWGSDPLPVSPPTLPSSLPGPGEAPWFPTPGWVGSFGVFYRGLPPIGYSPTKIYSKDQGLEAWRGVSDKCFIQTKQNPSEWIFQTALSWQLCDLSTQLTLWSFISLYFIWAEPRNLPLGFYHIEVPAQVFKEEYSLQHFL